MHLATIVGAGFDMLTVESLPIPVQVPMMIRIVGLPDKAEHTIAVRLHDPTLAETPCLSGTFVMGDPSETHPEGWEANAMFPAVIAFQATEAGAYSVTVDVDGTSSKTVVFRLVVAGA